METTKSACENPRLFSELWDILFKCNSFETPADISENVPLESTLKQPEIYGEKAVTPTDSAEPAAPVSSDSTIASPYDGQQTDLPAQALEPAALDQLGLKHLEDIRRFSSWNVENREQKLKTALTLFNEEYPEHLNESNKAIEQGRQDKILFEEAMRLGIQGRVESDLNIILSSLPSDTPKFVEDEMRERFRKGRLVKARRDAENKRKQLGEQLTLIQKRNHSIMPTTFPRDPILARTRASIPEQELHFNDIRALNPCDSWTLLIDETGACFDETVDQRTTARRLGRFVGLLVPDISHILPYLKRGWHAVDCQDPSEIDHVLQKVLNAEVGILGFDVKKVPLTVGERWMDGVSLIIDWVIRLMPIQNPCQLNVKIENRGVFDKHQSWDIVRRDCLRRLALSYPKRAAKLNLEIEVIKKWDHNCIGYVDAIAFTWGSPTDSSRARLSASELEGTCLLGERSDIDLRAMLNAWDAFAQGVHLPPTLWWDMLNSPDAGNPAAVISSFLDLVGQEARESQLVWSGFLAEVKNRMSASPVDMLRLSTAVEWLIEYQPDSCVMLPSLRLIWLTVRMARANHMGRKEQNWQEELEQLSNQLLDEASPLVCHADLHRAVSFTNRYEFEKAQLALARWSERPPAEAGLRYWGQVKSSLGQHAAFTGDPVKAEKYFREALSAFSRLSDPDIRLRDELQTGCYLAVALMDNPAAKTQEVRDAVQRITGPLPETAARLAESNAPSTRYAHHLLLRWLVQHGDDATWQNYLTKQTTWVTGDGHPWPLIQLYRAILLRKTDPKVALELALDAASLAFAKDQGPVLRLIGACCRTIASSWGSPWSEGEQELLHLSEQLPAAQAQIQILRTALNSSKNAIDFLHSVLPFNFR